MIHTTITAAASTSTTTISSTTTVTECANAEPKSFLKLVSSPIGLNGVSLDGTYANIDIRNGDLIGFNGDLESEATYFPLNAMNNLVIDLEELNNDPYEKLNAYTGSGQSFELLYSNIQYAVYTADLPTICSIAGGILELSNSEGGSNLLQLYPGKAVTNGLFLGNVVESGSVAPTLEVCPFVQFLSC